MTMESMERDRRESPGVDEPTVLDWVHSLLRGDPIPIPTVEESHEPPVRPEGPPRRRVPEPQRAHPEAPPAPARPALALASPRRIRLPAGLLLALAAQIALEHRVGGIFAGSFLYLLGAGLVTWGVLAGDVSLPALPASLGRRLPTDVRLRPLLVGLILALLTFLASGGNKFRMVTVFLWAGSFLFVFAALWEGPLQLREGWRRLRGWLAAPQIDLQLRAWHFIFLGSLLFVAWFRFTSLSTVPFEMWSDQAEKLLDVSDVLGGDTHIFFPRNSGREALEFYWAALVATTLNTGLSFLTLKLVSATAGLLSLPLLYLFAKEIGGRRVGLFAMILAGMAFWPNITSRAGLRMPLNELFVAPALFFLIRGLRRGDRNDFLWSGLALGVGLQGYSGYRVVPLAAVLGLILYLLHSSDGETRLRSAAAFGALVLVSVVGALPLLRVLVDMPETVLYRTMTRMGTLEQAYPNPPILQLLINTWDIMTMFAWDNGPIWVVTVPDRPALDWVTGALFHLGLVLMGLAYARRRKWQHLFLLLSIPILLLPSSLSLAFPNENPAPNRVSGAIVLVFTVAGFALDAIFRWAREHFGERRRLTSVGLIGGMLAISAGLNHHLVFDRYAEHQRASAWNNTEAGAVMRGFADSVGSFDTSYFVVFPFWIDSRLVAIEAGAPLRDYSVWPDDLPGQVLDPTRYHLYFIKPEHIDAMILLQDLHPHGVLSYEPSEVVGRDFYLYLVPPLEGPQPGSVDEVLP